MQKYIIQLTIAKPQGNNKNKKSSNNNKNKKTNKTPKSVVTYVLFNNSICVITRKNAKNTVHETPGNGPYGVVVVGVWVGVEACNEHKEHQHHLQQSHCPLLPQQCIRQSVTLTLTLTQALAPFLTFLRERKAFVAFLI